MTGKHVKALLLTSVSLNVSLAIGLGISITQLRHERELQREADSERQEEVQRRLLEAEESQKMAKVRLKYEAFRKAYEDALFGR